MRPLSVPSALPSSIRVLPIVWTRCSVDLSLIEVERAALAPSDLGVAWAPGAGAAGIVPRRTAAQVQRRRVPDQSADACARAPGSTADRPAWLRSL